MIFKNTVFYLDQLSSEDAMSLSQMMLKNKERFKRYFPKTLAQNTNIKDSETYILQKNKETSSNEEFTYAIKDRISNEVIGIVIIKELDWSIAQGELAYCIDSDYGGKGIMTTAVTALSNYAFKTLDLKRLQIIVHKDNIASVNVAKKSAYLWQRTLINEYTPPNEKPLDMELYELTQ